MARLEKDAVLAATEAGKLVILHYYPQASVGFTGRRNFKLRADDKNPSGTVFQKDGVWLVQDKGGADTKAYSAISLVMDKEGLNYPQSLEWIASRFCPHLLESGQSVAVGPKPRIEKTTASDKMEVVCRQSDFTAKELEILGHNITQKLCDDFYLKPVEYYITKKNDKGISYKIFATEVVSDIFL